MTSPESPSRAATIMMVALCLPLPLNTACGYGAFAAQRTTPDAMNPFLLPWFFTFLPVFFVGLYLVEPIVAIMAIVNTVKATRGAASGTRLLVCWAAFAVHSIVLLWLLTRPTMRR
jgi:hypothetical protein